MGVSTYNEGWFLRLSRPQPCAQYAYIYLTTGPATCIIPGIVYNLGPAGLAEMMRWPLEGFMEAFREGQEQGIFEADFDARLIFIPRALEYNKPQSPNVVKGWEHTWSEIPVCQLKIIVWQRLKDLTEGLGKAFQEAFTKACPEPLVKTCPNKEKEQDKEKEQEQDLFCAKPQSGSAPAPVQNVLLSLPLNDKTEHGVSEQDVAEYAQLYPAVDVAQQLRNMKGWLMSNPKNRKTRDGVQRFITNWLKKEQDKSRANSSAAKNKPPGGAFRGGGDSSRFSRPADFVVS